MPSEDFFSEVERMERRMRKISEDIARSIKEFEYSSGCLEPLYEVYETPEEVIVSVDMPGVKKEDVSLEATEDKLYVDAECGRSISVRKWGVSSQEKTFKRFRKVIPLPSSVDPERAKASLKGGLLKIRFPRKKAGTRIDIE
ncbi:MAG: Hsp20/alpha crystallin family protein [Candidatus Brockarchaeota archaeon]|nr:Hsp20/alpha crystallin family protein [Candidatus Brockarchaeota archaeon]